MDGVLFIVMVINPLPYERTNKCLVDSEMVINPLPYERGGSRTKMISLCEEFGIPSGLGLRFLLMGWSRLRLCLFVLILKCFFNKFRKAL
jgi:hypothetical protein